MLGAVAGDILGSFYEHSRLKFYEINLLCDRSKFTDDTVMTLAVASWLMTSPDRSKTDLIRMMVEFGRAYPLAGYGYNFKKWLNSDNPQPYNSWGNGAAMRVSPCGLYAATLDEALGLAKLTAEVSHNHPEGIKGAQAVAASVWMAKHCHSKDDIREYITDRFGYDLGRTVEEIRPDYKWELSCQGSVPESIICFLECKDYEDAVRLAISLGGDADTMACIAGSMAACLYPIPEWITSRCEELLTPDLLTCMQTFEDCVFNRDMTGFLDLF